MLLKVEAWYCTFLCDGSRFMHNNRIGHSIFIHFNTCVKVTPLRGMIKNLPLLRRAGNNGHPWVYTFMYDNTYNDICMIIHGDSCFNLVKSANRYRLHMTVRRTTRVLNGTIATTGLFIMCPSANTIRIKDKLILRVIDSGICFRMQ